jgi:hypothetical protein
MLPTKSFNITGPCIPSMHYMVDTSAKINQIITEYIEPGSYFTINRARQFGKTTTLELLYQRLRHQYVVMDMSFEGMGSMLFRSEEEFITAFLHQGILSLQDMNVKPEIIQNWISQEKPPRFLYLSEKISQLAGALDKGVILMIDEVDKTSNNQLFLDFLGMLREKYIRRATRQVPTFLSVILVGVYDVRNLKLKLRPDEVHQYNSPWNIAVSFDVDMSFNVSEISSMLSAFEQDYHTGMNAMEVSKHLYYFTNGYPFLVSALCKIIHEEGLSWDKHGVDEAENRILKVKNTLFDDLNKNLVNHPSFGNLVRDIVLDGENVLFDPDNSDIDLGLMFGIIIRRDGFIRIANVIFETRILNYYISITQTKEKIDQYIIESPSPYVLEGDLQMGEILQRFSIFLRSEYRVEDGTFIERQGRLLFLSFLKPIINGVGNYAVEPQTRGNRRMDVVVFYGKKEYIVELKIWHGEHKASAAYDQLIQYLETRGEKEGYLLSFCDNKISPREGGTLSHKGYKIHEVIVAYRDRI